MFLGSCHVCLFQPLVLNKLHLSFFLPAVLCIWFRLLCFNVTWLESRMLVQLHECEHPHWQNLIQARCKPDYLHKTFKIWSLPTKILDLQLGPGKVGNCPGFQNSKHPESLIYNRALCTFDECHETLNSCTRFFSLCFGERFQLSPWHPDSIH